MCCLSKKCKTVRPIHKAGADSDLQRLTHKNGAAAVTPFLYCLFTCFCDFKRNPVYQKYTLNSDQITLAFALNSCSPFNAFVS